MPLPTKLCALTREVRHMTRRMRLTGIVALALVGAGSAALGAELPAKSAAAVEPVRACTSQGAGFFSVPGSETCVKVSGRVRSDYLVGQARSRVQEFERLCHWRPGPARRSHPDALRAFARGRSLRHPRHEELRSGHHSRLSATASMRWLAPFFRIRLARWRVGTMFSRRLVRLMRVHRPSAVAIASSSGISA